MMGLNKLLGYVIVVGFFAGCAVIAVMAIAEQFAT